MDVDSPVSITLPSFDLLNDIRVNDVSVPPVIREHVALRGFSSHLLHDPVEVGSYGGHLREVVAVCAGGVRLQLAGVFSLRGEQNEIAENTAANRFQQASLEDVELRSQVCLLFERRTVSWPTGVETSLEDLLGEQSLLFVRTDKHPFRVNFGDLKTEERVVLE